MTEIEAKKNWTDFLKFFCKANTKRPTRIGLYQVTGGTANDYWLEDGLPLLGLDVEFDDGLPIVQIMLDGYTHVVRDVRTLRPVYSSDGSDDGIDLVREGGSTTLLRFENR